MKTNEISKTVLNNIYVLSADKSIHIKDIEAHLGVSHGYFHKAKSKGQSMTIDNCVKLAELFNINIETLCRKIVDSPEPDKSDNSSFYENNIQICSALNDNLFDTMPLAIDCQDEDDPVIIYAEHGGILKSYVHNIPTIKIGYRDVIALVDISSNPKVRMLSRKIDAHDMEMLATGILFLTAHYKAFLQHYNDTIGNIYDTDRLLRDLEVDY